MAGSLLSACLNQVVDGEQSEAAVDGKGLFLLLFPSVSNNDTRELHRWAAQLDEVVAGARAQGIDLPVLDSNRIASRIFAMVWPSRWTTPCTCCIGQIAILGVVCTFLGTTVFFPALLALLERWKLRKVQGAGEGAMVQKADISTESALPAEPAERKSA